jgi:citrate lyase subunit beta/citryl-CoA lyase
MTSAGGGKRVPRAGDAGRRGDKVRSDAWFRVEIGDSGGIRIELESRVEPYYGDAIREQVRSSLELLGIESARVEIEDSGALPFVLAARLETAVLRAGIEPRGDARPPRSVPQPVASAKDRLRRSRLYLPGNEPKYFVNAGFYGPDGVILDLEDSVHPNEKDAARLLVRNALRTVDFRGAERMVRINQLPLGLKDLVAIVPERPEMILIPKVETAEQVEEVDQAVTKLLGVSKEHPLWLMPILESALGVENSFEIARAGTRVAALTIGLEDYAADVGVPKSSSGVESLFARSRIVNAAKAAGVQAIDSVYGQVDDVEGLRRWASGSRQLGFQGMGCLHPRQVTVIHEAFNPSPDAIARARKIVAAFERAQTEGQSVVSLGAKMIDPPVVKQAQRLVEQARALGLLDAPAVKIEGPKA